MSQTENRLPEGMEVCVGVRVEDTKTGHRGTVGYVGQVEGSTGTWIGVDWDSVERGRHDGSHSGVRYFSARCSTSGSFVRPGRLTLGTDIATAVRHKYQATPPDTAPVESMLASAMHARFVQFVGMDKVSQKQSDLGSLRIIELKHCRVSCVGPSDLTTLLPRLEELSLCGNLLSSWQSLASLVTQLPALHTLNLSDNRLEEPPSAPSYRHAFSSISHLVLNRMTGYGWRELLSVSSLFCSLTSLRMAFNQLQELGPVPEGVLDSVEKLDIGANPIEDWGQILYLSSLQRLTELNANDCLLQKVFFPPEEDCSLHSTSFFPCLRSLFVTNNPLDNWSSVCELARLRSLEELVLGFEVKPYDYFHEYTYAIIRPLKMLNRTLVTSKEKRDYELFYLKKFSRDYYRAGGTEDPLQAHLSQDFLLRHPTYLAIVKECGAPYDDSKETAHSQGRLRDQKMALKVSTMEGHTSEVSIHPSIKVSRLKMTLRRTLKLPSSAKLSLHYIPSSGDIDMRIPLDKEHKEVSFFSVQAGDSLSVSW